MNSPGRTVGSSYVMYGQTEAAPRISYVPPQDLASAHDTDRSRHPGGADLAR